MKKGTLMVALVVGGLAVCQAPENGARAEAESAETVGRGMMGGDMGAMHSRMMGGDGEAPETRATPASAEDCPDVDQALVDRGRQVFNGTGGCTACHGRDATGSTLAPDLTDDQWLNVDGSYGVVATLIRTGVAQPKQYPAPMPPEGGATLSDAQVCAAAAYVYSLSH